MKILLLNTLAILLSGSTGRSAAVDPRRIQQVSCRPDYSDCDETQFCGREGICHQYSCENWLLWGTWNKTSGVNLNDVGLTCEAYTKGEQENLHSVTFGCNGYELGIEAINGYTFSFNQRCSVRLGSQFFDCYQLAPDTNFSSFLSLTTATPSQSCGRTEAQIDGGLNANQVFLYQVTVTQDVGPFEQNPGYVRFLGPLREEFNETLAFQTIYAHVSHATSNGVSSLSTSTAQRFVFGAVLVSLFCLEWFY